MESTSAGAIIEVANTAGIIAKIAQWFSTPKQTIKQADANAYAIERAIEVAEKHPGWNISYEDGKLTLSECTPEELVARTQSRMLAEAVKKESNREKVLMLAANEVQQSNKISDEPVDEDWRTRFFHIVEDISSEDMQVVWSKILAGEIIQPGRFSLRTLETIRNVSKDEAVIFQKIIPLVVKFLNKAFITADTDILKKNGINYEMILRLGECGLINPNSLLTLDFTVTDHKDMQILNDKKLIKILGKDSNPLTTSCKIYPLTKAGEELHVILAHEYNEEYIFDLAKNIYTNNRDKVIVSIHDIVEHTEDGGSLYRTQPLHVFS